MNCPPQDSQVGYHLVKRALKWAIPLKFNKLGGQLVVHVKCWRRAITLFKLLVWLKISLQSEKKSKKLQPCNGNDIEIYFH